MLLVTGQLQDITPAVVDLKTKKSAMQSHVVEFARVISTYMPEQLLQKADVPFPIIIIPFTVQSQVNVSLSQVNLVEMHLQLYESDLPLRKAVAFEQVTQLY